jgi:hypothetical protein
MVTSGLASKYRSANSAEERFKKLAKERRQTMPVLANVLLAATPNR